MDNCIHKQVAAVATLNGLLEGYLEFGPSKFIPEELREALNDVLVIIEDFKKNLKERGVTVDEN